MRFRFRYLLLGLCLAASASYASFIETTMGTAVVNDATAAYFNPAALVLLKNPQVIPLLTAARFRTSFSGQSTPLPAGATQSGTASSDTDYYSPNFYAGMPINDRIMAGFSIVSNYATRDPEEGSILRYVQSSNNIQDYDVVPSVAVKINDYLALGAGVNFSYLDFHLSPIVAFPGTNATDGQASNQSSGSGIGANAGFLLLPMKGTLIGFNYRSVTTYRESGTSNYTGATSLTSNNYHFQLRTPAHSTLSLSQRLTPAFNLISTIQYIQWDLQRYININNAATLVGAKPAIVSASIPYYLHNTWMFTLGGNYRFEPSWIVRAAATYYQSPNNGFYQVGTGDSYILGTSVGYDINKMFTIDGSYAHAFIQNQHINISGPRFLIVGNNDGSRDSITLKLTVNVV